MINAVPSLSNEEAHAMLQTTQSQAALFDALAWTRKTSRSFLPEAVSRGEVESILRVAATAPSTFNTQPWQVHVLTGAAKQALTGQLVAAHEAASTTPFSPFPTPAPPAIVERQIEFGRRYYASLGIDRSDKAARSRQTARNFMFFDAPVGLLFTVDETLGPYSWVDIGLYLQTLMLAAHARGLGTCPQVSFVWHEAIVLRFLGSTKGTRLVCGLSLGYADASSPVNRVDMPREPVERFARWIE